MNPSSTTTHLRANSHLVGELALQPPETALTLYWKNGKVAATDGPYAETKEQLGGISILETRDLNHAIRANLTNSPVLSVNYWYTPRNPTHNSNPSHHCPSS
jgi:hypothetical protein